MKLQEAENIPDQENKYRRTIRDVVALCALAAVWVRYDRKLLAHSLVEVVLNALPLDFVLLQLRGLQGAPDVLDARLPGRPAWDNQKEKIAALLAPSSTELPHNEARSIPNPFGSGAVRIMRVAIGLDGEEGVVVLGTQRTDFPTEEDRLLLSMALNQAAIVLQRQRTEEAMRVAAAKLQLAVRGSNIGIWEIDMPDGILRNAHIDYMNVWEQLGYDRPLAPADFDTAIALIHPDDSTHTELSIGAYLSAASKNLEFEHRVRCKDGSYRWMLTRGVAIRNSAGIPIRLVGSSVDITDRKRAEEALRKSENRFRDYFELGLVGMAITSPTKGCLEVNEQLCRLLGYTREELLQKDWAELTHPDDLAADVAQFNRVMAGEIDGYTLDKRFIRKGGQFIDVTISVNCMRRVDGSCDSFLALVQDVTERTQAQEALRVAKGRLDSAMRGSNIGIWEVDMPDGNFQTGRVRHINFWEHLGYSAAEIALDVPTSLDFAHPDDRQHTQDAF